MFNVSSLKNTFPSLRGNVEIGDADQGQLSQPSQKGEVSMEVTTCASNSCNGERSLHAHSAKGTTVFQPQNGMLDTFTEMLQTHNIDFDDSLLSRVESFTALFVALRECQSQLQFIGIVTLFLKTLTTSSLLEIALTSFREIFPENEMEEQSEGTPTWLTLLKKAEKNWQLIIHNEGAQRLSRLLSLLVAVGLCEATNLQFTVGGLRVFQMTAIPKQTSALELIDAAFSTATYFIEGGYECMKTGSLDPLLYGDRDARQLEELFGKCEEGAILARAGNLAKIGMDNQALEMSFIKALALLRDMISVCKNPVMKRTLQDRQERLRRLHVTFQETRVQGGLREAPFGVGFYGGSGVGKSSIANITMITLLKANGFDASDENIVTLNESDKFMSNYRSSVCGVFIDDIGNTKAEFVERAPTAKIIEINNNVRCYATMAEADLKGKVSVEPRVVITTKNVKDTCAHTYSNEPVSIARREQMLVTVKVRDEFATNTMLDANKVSQKHHLAYPEDEMFPDIWSLRVERAYPIENPVEGKHALIGWELLYHEGRPLEDVDLKTFLQFAIARSKTHFADQKVFVEKSNNMASKICFCSRCKAPAFLCPCEKDEEEYLDSFEGYDPNAAIYQLDELVREQQYVEEQFGALSSVVAGFLWNKQYSITRGFMQRVDALDNYSTKFALDRLQWLESSLWCRWTNYVPASWFENKYFRLCILAENQALLRRKIFAHYCLLAGFFFFCLLQGLFFSFIGLPILVFILLWTTRVVEREKRVLYTQIRDDNKAMPLMFKRYRDGYARYLTAGCAVALSLYVAAKVWRELRILQSSKLVQGKLDPINEQDIEERELEASQIKKVSFEHNWTTTDPIITPSTNSSRCTTLAQLTSMVERNTAFMSAVIDGKVFGSDAFFIKSNVALIPKHAWHKDQMTVTFRRSTEDVMGTTFSSLISRIFSVDIPDTDLSLIWVPNGSSWKDLTEYLPLARMQTCPATFVHRTREGRIVHDRFLIQPGPVRVTTVNEYYGWSYQMSQPTTVGLCMSPLVSETRAPCIAGFHLAGATGTPRGAAGILLRSDFETAFEQLGRIPGVLLATSLAPLRPIIYDTQWFTSTEIEETSQVHSLPTTSNIAVLGSVIGKAKYFSEVTDTVISDAVYDVTGIPNKHAAPKFRKGDPFFVSLEQSANPSIGMPPDLLQKAVLDYEQELFDKIFSFPHLVEQTKPLNQMQILAGIDGRRFIDKMPGSTSIGYPLGGPKSNHLTLLNPLDYEDVACPVSLDQKFWDEFAIAEAAILRGERCNLVFKACLKDEPTKMDKDKVRVFQCAPIVLQLLTRKYFLPLARLMSLFPLVSECAVGCNPYGPEWDELARHVTKFGEDRVLAGDYAKYDLRMPSQCTLAAFRIYIDLAERCGYNQHDLIIMRGIATEICYPLMAYNGVLVALTGSHPSGQNLTVYLNSTVNSLLFRCGFFSKYPEAKSFRSACALTTYGDDAKSSVHTDYDEFNHIALADFLAQYDMKFTMPDKESTPTPYMHDKDADFLKRKNVVMENGMILGALTEDSIFKSLHSVLKSKAVTPEQQAMMNIDGALREWFVHGREKYELRRTQMQEVARLTNLSHGCTMLDRSFDDYFADWQEQYCPIQE